MSGGFNGMDYDINSLFGDRSGCNDEQSNLKSSLINELSKYTVDDLKKLINIKRRWDEIRRSGGNSHRVDINVSALIHDYRMGASANSLAKKYNCSYSAVVDRLKRAGVYRTREDIQKEKENGYDWVKYNINRGY